MLQVAHTFFCLSFWINPISYKRFIPESLNYNIKQRNFLTRIRINNVFKKFLNEFNRRTVKDSNITPYDLKIKYLATLEGLTSGLGSELLEPMSLSVTQEGDVCNGGHGKVSHEWWGCVHDLKFSTRAVINQNITKPAHNLLRLNIQDYAANVSNCLLRTEVDLICANGKNQKWKKQDCLLVTLAHLKHKYTRPLMSLTSVWSFQPPMQYWMVWVTYLTSGSSFNINMQ